MGTSSGVLSVSKTSRKCDRACENRACGLKYALLFDSTYLNTEMYYLNSVSSLLKPKKLSTNFENFVAISY